MMLGHFAARRASDPARARKFLAQSGESGSDPEVQFLRGDIDEAALLKWAADSKSRQTDAHVCLGLDHALKGNRQAAITHLRWVREHGERIPGDILYVHAICELDRLETSAKK